jgi:hypothetical protein
MRRTMIDQSDNRQNGDVQGGSAKEHPTKISNEFAHRLALLPSNHQVRAVVMPAPYLVNGSNGRRVHGEERQAILREARTRTEETFAEIDEVLACVGGQRLTESGNALGFIVVETTADGITAIAGLGWVGTVLEDQAIRPVHESESQSAR